MAFDLFKKPKTIKPAAKKAPKVSVAPVAKKESAAPAAMSGARSALKRFYVSEKAARLQAMNKYMFEVERTANKQEIRKQVEMLYKVHVTSVRVLNMPSKTRTVGRYLGQKPGYRKAIVALREGESIDQAKN